jgi:predicted HicB family RNase H-like nuclease
MNDIQMDYKGFKGSVNYNVENDRFYGKIEGTKDLITYEADDTWCLLKELKKAVDDYLDDSSINI